jgi:thymidylate synthase (FAD)
MKVELISYTQPNKEYFANDEVYTLTELIAYCARVSNPANQINSETVDRLLKYLIKNKHWSPFEMVDITLRIETTRDIGRQILRHASFRFQEFSQRYADPTQLGYELRTARLQDPKNRQNSIITDDEELIRQWNEWQEEVMFLAKKAYEWATEHNIAKEVARCVLPEGMMNSTMFVKGSIRSWIHYIQVREEIGTQLEHRLIAIECAKVIFKIFEGIYER